MDLSSSHQITESQNLNLETFSSQTEMSKQIAADGQTDITTWMLPCTRLCMKVISVSSREGTQKLIFNSNEPQTEHCPPYCSSVREGHWGVVKALIDAAKELQEMESEVGADQAMMRMENKEKDTALHEAVRYHHSKVVKLLIEADPQFIYGANSTGYTPLYMAAEREYGDLVEIIIHQPFIRSQRHRG
ncbi:hypothetical protein CK203_106118 [Vitis vinifera]|uniref:Uncharacterized protein n=1 Tax=Vitis vinifera TaxID=29760 RepID=A0A438FG08_VITVI|nr:hypothetical protein CK203_106118 [Vitis vinifera]